MTHLSRRRLLSGAAAVAALMLAAPSTVLARTINVPWMAQKTSNDCGRAVLASLAARRGGSPETYYSRLPTPSDARGYSINDMRRLGSRVGVGLSLRAPAGIVIAGDCTPRGPVTAHYRQLARAVSSGRPVVVPVARGFGSGHYLVLVGATADGFTVMDPAASGLRQMSTDSLASSMCGYGYVALVG